MKTNTAATPVMSESKEQQALFRLASYIYFNNEPVSRYMFAIPNGGSRRKRGGVPFEALRMRREGVRKGVPDLMLAIPAQGFHGLFIEMKREDKRLSRVSAEQQDWIKRLALQGYKASVCYGSDEAAKTIAEYLGIDK